MDFPDRRFLRVAAIAVVATAIFLFAANGSFFYANELSILINLALVSCYAIAGAVSVSGARRVGYRSYLGSAFLTIGVGMVAMAFGFVAESYYKFVAQVPVPYPSIADAFFFLYTPLVVIGLWMFLKIHSLRVTYRLLAEAAAVTAGCIALSFVFLGTLTLGRNMSLWNLIVGGPVIPAEALAEATSLLYLITDAIYVALAVLIARVSGGKMSFGLFLFAVGIALMTAGDVAYSILIENGTYVEGDVSDQLFLAAGLAQAVGLAHTIRPFVARFTSPATGTRHA
jgi:hypothetical protein